MLDASWFYSSCLSSQTQSAPWTDSYGDATLKYLILVHLRSRDSPGRASPLAHPVNARGFSNSCDDINDCRKLFDVVWGCLATIFACKWISVHPNVPPPSQSWLALFRRRLKMMVITIIAPEIMVGFVARQFFGARLLSKGELTRVISRLSCLILIFRSEFGFSKTHGFFLGMGGFVSSAGSPVATWEQLRDSTELQQAIRQVDAAEIMDKSKRDALSKGVALTQGLWFITLPRSCAPTPRGHGTRGCYAGICQHIPRVALVE
jgi:hypothetical protein